jgi:hypothetical protein
MKRGGPLRRHRGLSSGSTLRRSSPIKQATKREADPLRKAAFASAVLTVTINGQTLRRPCRHCGAPSQDPHHVLEKKLLYDLSQAMRWDHDREQALVWDPINGMPLCRRCHDEHERHHRKLPITYIEPGTWEFIDMVDELLGGRARASIERSYAA